MKYTVSKYMVKTPQPNGQEEAKHDENRLRGFSGLAWGNCARVLAFGMRDGGGSAKRPAGGGRIGPYGCSIRYSPSNAVRKSNTLRKSSSRS